MEAYLDKFELSAYYVGVWRHEVPRIVPDQLYRDSETEGPNERIRLFPCSWYAENYRPVPKR